MNKTNLVEALIVKLKGDLAILNQAATATYQGAIHQESKSEDPHDTRGLEASYLAGAQAKRVAELQDIIKTYQYIDLKFLGPKDKIVATALVGVQANEKKSYYLLMPVGGGLQIQHEGMLIQVLTPQSPLGEALLGKKLNDEFEVLIQGKFRDFEITSVE